MMNKSVSERDNLGLSMIELLFHKIQKEWKLKEAEWL
jgi:hypothetical protein